MGGNNGRVVLSGEAADRLVERALKAGWALKLTRHSWGNRRKLAQDLLEEKFAADAEAINAVQKLLLCKELQAVNQVISWVNKKVDDLSQPWLGEGVYWFIEERVPIMEEYLQKASAEMKPASRSSWPCTRSASASTGRSTPGSTGRSTTRSRRACARNTGWSGTGSASAPR